MAMSSRKKTASSRSGNPATVKFTVLALVLMVFIKVFVVDGIGTYRGDDATPQSDRGNMASRIVIEEQQGQAFAVLPPIQTSEEEAAFQKGAPERENDGSFALGMPQPKVIQNEDELLKRYGLQEPRSDDTLPRLENGEEEQSAPYNEQDSDAPSSATSPEKSNKLEEHVEDERSESSAKLERIPDISMPRYAQREGLFEGQRPKIVIIIDDMGLARQNSKDIIDLPAPLTLAFLPYAGRLDEFTKPAMEKGHELIIHVPMEPMGAGHDLGPAGLTTKLSETDFKDILNRHVFPSFEGYVGINNHMGSRLTQSKQAMGWVMAELKNRGLYFVDSKTIGSSIAARVAMEHGVPFAERDVFLDHYDTYDSVMKALAQLESVARRQGVAIAIGHPKRHTIEALRKWMPDIEQRGLELVPASAVLHRPEADIFTSRHVVNNDPAPRQTIAKTYAQTTGIEKAQADIIHEDVVPRVEQSREQGVIDGDGGLSQRFDLWPDSYEHNSKPRFRPIGEVDSGANGGEYGVEYDPKDESIENHNDYPWFGIIRETAQPSFFND